MVDEVGMNKLVIDLQIAGHTKSSEVYKKLYRDVGLSLSGYGDVFCHCEDEEDEE